jgi:hypothetical protein
MPADNEEARANGPQHTPDPSSPDTVPAPSDDGNEKTVLRALPIGNGEYEAVEVPDTPEPGVHNVNSFSALDQVSETVRRGFPEIHTETIYALAVPATLLLADQQNPVALNLEGPPSSAKTTLADFFDPQCCEEKVYLHTSLFPLLSEDLKYAPTSQHSYAVQ